MLTPWRVYLAQIDAISSPWGNSCRQAAPGPTSMAMTQWHDNDTVAVGIWRFADVFGADLEIIKCLTLIFKQQT